jgi:AcrR family transcriptional regulator
LLRSTAVSSRNPRWRRRPAERPRQILDAAFRVFGARGLHRATLDDVAREAGITKGTIYLYFSGKAALFSAMITAKVDTVVPEVPAAAGARRAPAARVRLTRIARELFAFFRSPAYLAMYRTIVSEAAEFPDGAAVLYRKGILPANRRIAEVIARGIAGGEFRPVDAMLAARAFAGMFQVFAVTQELLGGKHIFPVSDTALIRTLTDIFFHGLQTPSKRSVRGRP